MPTEPAAVALLAVALAFAVVNGVNDGAALTGAGLRLPLLRPLAVIGILAAGVAIMPVVFGARVAQTLATGLVPFSDAQAVRGLLVGTLAAVVVVGVLTWRGAPTSLTLALVGGIAGAGVGLGEAVRWGEVGRVLGIGFAAPVVGGAAGFSLLRVWGRVPARASVRTRVRRAHVAGLLGQAAAYGANDGQKMLAVTAVALAGAGTDGRLPIGWYAVLALLFALGTALGLRRVGGVVAGEVLLQRPAQAVTAEVASAGAVVGSAALGAPVSMTQSLTGALVGAGWSDGGYRRVRWRVAARLVAAWFVTLPAAGVLAAGATAVAGRL